ncbi:hypothetical protein D3C76_1228580 [compost metagenome]
MRATGVGDQRIARTSATLDQVMQLMLGRFQATRLHVGCIHGRRQVNGDDQWRPVLQEVRAILFPGRPGGGNRTDHQQCADQMHRTQPLLILRGNQQVRQQVFGDVAAQTPLQVAAAAPEQWQQRGKRQQQQPEWAQEVEVAEVDLHLRPPAAGVRWTIEEIAWRSRDRARARQSPPRAATRTDRVWVDG